MRFVEVNKKGTAFYHSGTWEIRVHKNKLTDEKTAVAYNHSIEGEVFHLQAKCTDQHITVQLMSAFPFCDDILQKTLDARIRFDDGAVMPLQLSLKLPEGNATAHFPDPEMMEVMSRHRKLVIGVTFDPGTVLEREVIEEFDLSGADIVLHELVNLGQQE